MKRALVALLFLAGCPDPEYPDEVELFGMTGAPPAGQARITNDRHGGVYAIDLSLGVAIAAQCWSTCGGTCTPKIHVDDPELLEVRPVYRVNGTRGDVALIAKRAGSTTIAVETSCATRTYNVKIVGP